MQSLFTAGNAKALVPDPKTGLIYKHSNFLIEDSMAKSSKSGKKSLSKCLETPTDISGNAVPEIAEALNRLVADNYALYAKTKNFHWHVSGPHFRDYHLLFDEQAAEIFATIDDLAERVRKLGARTIHSIGEIARLQTIKDNEKSGFGGKPDPFLDERLKVANLPMEPQKLKISNPVSGAEKEVSMALFKKAGEAAGPRRAISEVIKWMNYVTENRFFTLAADLSESINVEHGSLWGHYDPVANPLGTRIKASIQEAGNVSTAIGLVSQSASVDPEKFAGVWALSGTYGAFTPLMYTPARVWSQQNQDSKFRMGVLHILAGHSGPETAADGRTHFGIFATQVWKLFPRGQTIHLNFWDYNDVAAGYFAAAEIAARDPKVGIISIEVARPDFPVADRAKFADTDLKAAAKGFYVIRDFAPGQPKHGYIVTQGSSSTVNLVSILPRLEQAGINVKVVAAISEELFDRQPEAYRNSVLPPESRYDLMVVSTGTRRMWPLRDVGPLTDAYSLTSDWDNQWLTGGLEPEVIAEAHLDKESIAKGIERFARDRATRLGQQKSLLNSL